LGGEEMVSRRKPRKIILTDRATTVSISNNLISKIRRKQKIMQKIENTTNGRGARAVTFLWASDELAKEVVKIE